MPDNPKSKIMPSNEVKGQNPKLSQLRQTLERVQTRLRLQEAVSLLPAALSLALAAALLLTIIGRFRSALTWPVLLVSAGGFALAALLTATAYAFLRPRDLMATARRADHLLSLDERLSTALEDAQRPPPNVTPEQQTLWQAQLDDALIVAAQVSPARDLPLRLERRKLLPIAVVLVAIFAAIFAPLPGQDLFNNGAVQAQVSNERQQIEELKKAVQSQPTLANDPAHEALLKELDELSRDLSRGELTKEEALARLSEAESRLEKQLDSKASAQREAMDQLARQLAASANSDAKEVGEKLKEGDTQKAADALKKAGQNASSMSEQQRKDLAQSLRQARDSVASLDPELASRLNEAASALESNDPKAAENAMNNLSQQIQQTNQNLATQQQIQQALGQIQQSKGNVAQAGQTTPVAATPGAGTSQAGGTNVAANGTPLSGTPIVALGSRTPGAQVALGSPVKGQLSKTGTPVLIQGTPGKGTPVVAQGQGQGQGQQQGQGQGQGQGQNGSQGLGQGQGQSGNKGNPSGGWGKGHNDPVYAPPSSVNAAGTPVTLQGQNNPNGEQSSTTTNTDLNNTGPAQVPYNQVYGQYQQQAGNALNNDYIPQGYKDLVKDYFTSIDPSKP